MTSLSSNEFINQNSEPINRWKGWCSEHLVCPLMLSCRLYYWANWTFILHVRMVYSFLHDDILICGLSRIPKHVYYPTNSWKQLSQHLLCRKLCQREVVPLISCWIQSSMTRHSINYRCEIARTTVFSLIKMGDESAIFHFLKSIRVGLCTVFLLIMTYFVFVFR